MKRWMMFFWLVVVISSSTQAEDVVIQPQGEFAEIKLEQQREAIRGVAAGNAQMIQQVIDNSGHYAPPVLYLLSNVLLSAGKGDEAMFWFYTGQMRARSDANKALDISAREAVAVLNNDYGPAVNRYAFRDLAKLQRVVARVVESDRQTARHYDPRWIALHGMDAFTKTTIAFEPASRWVQIDETTRTDYYNEFRRAITSMVSSNEN